jgi:hypothetical protein
LSEHQIDVGIVNIAVAVQVALLARRVHIKPMVIENFGVEVIDGEVAV